MSHKYTALPLYFATALFASCVLIAASQITSTDVAHVVTTSTMDTDVTNYTEVEHRAKNSTIYAEYQGKINFKNKIFFQIGFRS